MESQVSIHAAELTSRLTASQDALVASRDALVVSQDVAQDAHAALAACEESLSVGQVQVLNEQNQMSDLIGFIESFANRTSFMENSMRPSRRLLRLQNQERRVPSSFIGATYVEDEDVSTIELHEGETPAHVEELRSRSGGLPRGEVMPVGIDYPVRSNNSCVTPWLCTMCAADLVVQALDEDDQLACLGLACSEPPAGRHSGVWAGSDSDEGVSNHVWDDAKSTVRSSQMTRPLCGVDGRRPSGPCELALRNSKRQAVLRRNKSEKLDSSTCPSRLSSKHACQL
jgi:hypothetical protein